MFVMYGDGKDIFITLAMNEKKLLKDMKEWGYDVEDFDRIESEDDSLLISAGIMIE